MADRAMTVTTYIASGVSIVLGVMNEYAAAFGLLLALATFIFNVWFKMSMIKHKIAEE